MSRNKAGREMENKRTPIGTRPHSHSSRADSSLLLLPVLLWKESVLVGPWEPNLSPTSQTKPGGPITHFPPHCSSHQLSWLCLTYSFLPQLLRPLEHPISWRVPQAAATFLQGSHGISTSSGGGRGGHRGLFFPSFVLKSSWLLTTNKILNGLAWHQKNKNPWWNQNDYSRIFFF